MNFIFALHPFLSKSDVYTAGLGVRGCKKLTSTLLDNDANKFFASVWKRQKKKEFVLLRRENMSMAVCKKEADENTIEHLRVASA